MSTLLAIIGVNTIAAIHGVAIEPPVLSAEQRCELVETGKSDMPHTLRLIRSRCLANMTQGEGQPITVPRTD